MAGGEGLAFGNVVLSGALTQCLQAADVDMQGMYALRPGSGNTLLDDIQQDEEAEEAGVGGGLCDGVLGAGKGGLPSSDSKGCWPAGTGIKPTTLPLGLTVTEPGTAARADEDGPASRGRAEEGLLSASCDTSDSVLIRLAAFTATVRPIASAALPLDFAPATAVESESPLSDAAGAGAPCGLAKREGCCLVGYADAGSGSKTLSLRAFGAAPDRFEYADEGRGSATLSPVPLRLSAACTARLAGDALPGPACAFVSASNALSKAGDSLDGSDAEDSAGSLLPCSCPAARGVLRIGAVAAAL
ncbi:MAG: hypothetical protein FRX49_00890 [Trebouxia sp. A1-2]|nr:MAG: hypothetical protein FRX49_00890 [Trebouxia sp. A1-2]